MARKRRYPILEARVASWRTFLCRVLWLHKPTWRYHDEVRVSYCPRCKVVDEIESLFDGSWS